MTPYKFVLTFGRLHLCVKFGENRQRNATVRVMTHGQTNRHTDTQTDRQTYAIAMGQIITSRQFGPPIETTHVDTSYIYRPPISYALKPILAIYTIYSTIFPFLAHISKR